MQQDPTFLVSTETSDKGEQNVLYRIFTFGFTRARSGAKVLHHSRGVKEAPWEHAADTLTSLRPTLRTQGLPVMKGNPEPAIYAALGCAQAVEMSCHVFCSMLRLGLFACCQEAMFLAADLLSVAAAHPTAIFWLVLWCLLGNTRAVVCLSCHDGIPGCAGGASCPFYSTPFINGEILRSETGSYVEAAADEGEADITHTLLVAVAVLPRVISRFLSRGVLDFFKTVARRPAAGTVPDIATLSVEDLVVAVRGGSVTPDDAMASLLSRLSDASAAQVPRLNALVSTIGLMIKSGSRTTMVGTGANGELLGVFTFAWTQAGRVVQHSGASLAVAGDSSSHDSSESKAILQAKILRQRNQGEFAPRGTQATRLRGAAPRVCFSEISETA